MAARGDRIVVEVLAVQTSKASEVSESTSGRGGDWRDSARHAEDWSNCIWFGTIHHFTPTQAKAIKVLWEAFDKGLPDLLQATILTAANSGAGRLRKLFDGHSAWGVMIHPSSSFGGRVGSYRLARPQ